LTAVLKKESKYCINVGEILLEFSIVDTHQHIIMKTRNNTRQSLIAVLAFAILGSIHAFTSPHNVALAPTKTMRTSLKSTTSSEVSYEPVFDFSDASKDTVASFDRIDDAIMGGISTSSIRASGNEEESYASWSGVCRTDGGGFCGTRTLPFRDGKPLTISKETDGFYLKLRLASDNEPERRIWKITTRVENNSRTEQLYQAMFQVPKQENDDTKEWKTVKVPFDSFVQVRGPRIVENGPPLDPSGGLFQIGMVMSKFQIASNLTELADFRPGYFELQLQEIGVYSKEAATGSSMETPETLTKKEADENKPLALKILFPIAKLFFNEKRSRQKSATKFLKKRGLGRFAIAKFGFQRKVASKGIAIALAQSLVGLVATMARLVVFYALKFALFYPLVAIRRTMNKLKKSKSKTKAEAN